MADGTKAYIEDQNGNKILPATDWSIIQNKPNDLAKTGQLPTLGGQQRDGIAFQNGAEDYDHANNGYNCTYRVADFGSFKAVELRLIFSFNHDIGQNQEVKALTLPAVVNPDQNIEHTQAVSDWANGLAVVRQAGRDVSLITGNATYKSGDPIFYSFTYFTTL